MNFNPVRLPDESLRQYHDRLAAHKIIARSLQPADMRYDTRGCARNPNRNERRKQIKETGGIRQFKIRIKGARASKPIID